MEQVANTCSVTTITYSLHRYHRFHQQVLYLFIEYGIFCLGEGTGTCSFSRWDLLAQLVYQFSQPGYTCSFNQYQSAYLGIGSPFGASRQKKYIILSMHYYTNIQHMQLPKTSMESCTRKVRDVTYKHEVSQSVINLQDSVKL